MACDGCYILRLPTELLESISSHISTNDLLSLRRSCRAFAEVTVHDFATHYFHEVTCFFPDPARAQRLLDITSQPHLAGKITEVHLTLDAFEYGDGKIQFVAPRHDRGDTLPEYKEIIQRLELEYHCSRLQNLHRVTQSLKNLNPLQTNLHLDLTYRLFFSDHVKWASISQKGLAAIGRAVYPIHNLAVFLHRDLSQPYVSHPEAEDEPFIAAHEYDLYCTPYHDTSVTSVGSLSDFKSSSDPEFQHSTEANTSAVAGTNEAADSLDCIFWQWPPHEPKVLHFASEILTAHGPTHLRRLNLVRVRLPKFEHLFKLLRRCSSTLDILMLNEIEVATNDCRQWKTLFEILQTMPLLQHLQVDWLWWRREYDMPILVVNENNYLALRCCEAGCSSVKAAVQRILSHGVTARSGSRGLCKLW